MPIRRIRCLWWFSRAGGMSCLEYPDHILIFVLRSDLKGALSMNLRKACLAVFLIQASSMVLAQSDVAAAARANRARVETKKEVDSEWDKATRVSLRAQEEGSPGTTTYEISGSQELKITMDAKGKQGQHETGEIMLINGQHQWMLMKNVPFEKGYEIDALDGPVLELKLVLELLRAAAPGGPNEIRKRTTFNVDEKTRP